MLVFKGLDKLEINGLNITHIEYSKLENNKNVIISNEGRTVFKNNRKVSYLKISNDELFSSLVWGIKIEGNCCIEYCILTLKVSELGQNNLIPYNVGYYKKRIYKVLEKLERVYGLTMQGNLEVKTLEYNKTIFLEKPLKEYEKSLLILEQVVPKRLKSVIYKGKQKDIEIIYIKNNSRSYKFYNKSKQLEEVHGIECEKEVLRIEYSMNTKEQIEKELGSSDINNWTDEQLEKTFIENFEKDFIIPYQKEYEKGIKEITKMAKEYKKEQRQGWLDKAMIQAEKKKIIFAKEQLYEVAKNIDKTHIGRLKQRIDKQYGECNQEKIMQEIFDFIIGC